LLSQLVEGVEYLAEVDERRHLELRVHAEDPHLEHFRPQLRIEEQQIIPVEPILGKAAERIDTAEGGQDLERDVRGPGDAFVDSPQEHDQATLDEGLEIPGLDTTLQVVRITPEQLRGRLSKQAHIESLGRRRERVAGIANESDPLSVD